MKNSHNSQKGPNVGPARCKEVAGEWGERVYEEGLIKIKINWDCRLLSHRSIKRCWDLADLMETRRWCYWR